MKNLVLLIGSMIFFMFFSININATSSLQSTAVEDSIQVWTSPDLYDLATTWASAYERIKPETKIAVSSVSASMATTMTVESRNIGFIKKDYFPNAGVKNNWKMKVGRDILVPIMSSENPFIEEVYKTGVSSEKFANVFKETEKQIWGTLLNNDNTNHVNCYYLANDLNMTYLADFSNTEINKIKGKGVSGINEMLIAMRNDKYAIGFCRLVDILDSESQEIREGIKLIPIDNNSNNKLDYFERIYDNSSVLERGVWVGKYPKELYSNIYAVAGVQPIKNNEIEFLKWIVTEGQQLLVNQGYSELILSERQSKVQGLYANQLTKIEAQKPGQSKALIVIVALVIFGALISLVALTLVKYKNEEIEEKTTGVSKVFSESTVLAPNGLFFDKSHTWAFMEKDGFVRIGIADFLQHITGPITNVKMKSTGDEVKKGEPFLTIVQHGKQLEIHSPISGKIKQVNDNLQTNSTAINSSPYAEGWVYLIESPSWLKEIKSYFMGETYKIWLNGEFLRLKNFFSSFLKLDVTNQFQQVIQDGGELNDGIMESFGPVIWEEFQSRFMNREK